MQIRTRALLLGGLLGLVAACARSGPSGTPSAKPPARRPPEAAARPVLGAILPRTGSPYLTQYGDLVLEGIRLALSHEAPRGLVPDLVLLDDAGDAERDAALVKELERRGAVAVLGPLLSPGLTAAGRARTDSMLALVSPTASTVPDGLPNVYSLNAGDTRGAAALAAYAARHGWPRVAMLYPRSADFQRTARVFELALARAGGRVVVDLPYDSGTTTFARPLRRALASGAQALFIPAPERDVRQIAPQLAYYGVTGKGLQILGGEAWTSDELLRVLPAENTDGVIAATPLQRSSPRVAWSRFVSLYEAAYRKSLDNPFPALGFDATRMVLQALEGGGGAREVARRLGRERDLEGATGILSLRDGAVVRRPFIVRIEGGKLVTLEQADTTSGDAGKGR